MARVQAPQERGDAPGQGWGYTGVFAKVNGGGFLTDHFPDSYKAIWDFHGQDATSRHIPGVRYTGITHPGLFGTAPSAGLLAEWNRREQALIDRDPNRVPPLALPPLEDGVLAGTASGPELQRIGREGARTVPARENGGNHDIKNFTQGSRVYYPVHVAGGMLSGGDLHFSPARPYRLGCSPAGPAAGPGRDARRGNEAGPRGSRTGQASLMSPSAWYKPAHGFCGHASHPGRLYLRSM